MARRYSFPMRLRPEARAAAVMLATVQQDDSHKGWQSWIGDLVDMAVCLNFAETFGITVTEFLQRVRALVARGRRAKYVPQDPQLETAARRLLEIRFAAIGGLQGAKPAGETKRRRVRLKGIT